MRKLLLIALTVVLTAPMSHADGDDFVADGVVYGWYAQNNQYGYIVTGWDEETPIQSLHIRGEVDGYQVYGIDDRAFEDNKDIVYLTIDEGVTFIGENAFCRCTNLKVAILPEGLEKICEEAFYSCTSLTTMVIPSTVTEIQAHAFSECTSVTDAYFLMTEEEQLADFAWWDGVYGTPDEEEHGGMEFNTNQHTTIHVPEGMLQAYVDSEKFEAWLPLAEDNGSYPLWWIVNYGTVGHEYTVSDDLAAVYVDVNGGLYAKDDNRWLTPDRLYPSEIDYMKMAGLADSYDQSNWVVLTDLPDPYLFNGYQIKGSTITGTLLDKKNPVIKVLNEDALVKGDKTDYEKNIYIPASFMSRAQLGANDKTYAFVQPKPQELIHVVWAIYSDNKECFYLPTPDEDNGINQMDLKGGVKPLYDLYYGGNVPELADCGVYDFDAINRRIAASEESKRPASKAVNFSPYAEGGISDTFVVLPLELPNEPIITGISDIINGSTHIKEGWYTIDGRHLGNTRPTAPGLYIHGHRKLIIR